MEGRAYNPEGFEPDAHETFFAPPREVMELWMKIFNSKDPHSNRTNYDQIQEFRRRGESHLLGHYAYEMMYDIYAGIEDEILDGAIDSHVLTAVWTLELHYASPAGRHTNHIPPP